MSRLNYNHLYYFYVVATEGSITKASERLHLTPQTISGQISAFESQIEVDLFNRKGKKLLLSESGREIYSYAEEIFQLGDELKTLLKTQQPSHWHTLKVGVTDVIPKILAFQLLKPVLHMEEQVRLICSEGEQDSLLAELAVDKLDLVITDRALQPGSHIKAYNHKLVESGYTFFAPKQHVAMYAKDFPQSLSEQPMLMQSIHSSVRQNLRAWFEQNDITPNIIAEFDDSALIKSFGQAGYGIFAGPTIIEEYIASQYNVGIIGRIDKIKESYYAISPERRLKHPAIVEIVNSFSDVLDQHQVN